MHVHAHETTTKDWEQRIFPTLLSRLLSVRQSPMNRPTKHPSNSNNPLTEHGGAVSIEPIQMLPLGIKKPIGLSWCVWQIPTFCPIKPLAIFGWTEFSGKIGSRRINFTRYFFRRTCVCKWREMEWLYGSLQKKIRTQLTIWIGRYFY